MVSKFCISDFGPYKKFSVEFSFKKVLHIGVEKCTMNNEITSDITLTEQYEEKLRTSVKF